jgi:DNA topoisomerase-2
MSATKRPLPPSSTSENQQPKYEKLSLHAQILLRPDTYIGSVKGVKSVDPVWVAVNNKIKKAEVECNEGLTRVFIEVLSNAIDNVWRSVEKGTTPKLIKVDLTPTTCRIWNDGLNIPTGQHSVEKIPTPELIFGHLLTSSNYNDAEERKTSGRNGYGVKLANIFSSSFTVDIYNKEEKVKYSQKWTGNMKVCGTPSLVATKSIADKDDKNGFTCVTWTPDFARFGCECFSEDMLSVLKKSVYDAAMTVSIHKVSVVLNGEKIAMSKLTDYVQMYECCAEPTLSMQSSDCFVVLAPATEYTCVSFVNGIFTRDGGVHVDKWVEAAFRPIADKMKGKIGDLRDIKKYFFVFVFATLDKPTFDTQSKNRLNGPAVAVDVKPSHISKLLKWDFIAKIEQSHKLKEMLSFQKETERGKKKNVVVEGLDDANFAGKANKNCVLTITEGLSARTYVIAGMKYGFGPYKGRDTIGVLPIRGKFVNVKNASTDLLKKNKELIGITQALGLVFNTDYSLNENFNKLRYKKLMVICDADTDGSHILGLLYNLFHTLYPTLLDRLGFFCFMRVPIVKIGSGATVTNYYHYEQAKKVLESAPGSGAPVRGPVRYFKGLGTSRDEDIKNDFGKRIVHLQRDDGANQMMTNVFDTEETEFRKQWLQAHEVKTEFPVIKDGEIEVLSVTDFLNHELILYSIDHCKRSIPSLIDGLKESTRKVLFGAIKKNLRFAGESMKVAQFANYVAEKTNYHHGEMNLYDTVIKMAQRFVGSNNIPLFYNDGQFGSRLENGKDASDGRYIFTKLEASTRLIFRPEDDDYLVIRKDDGDEVEPLVYFPIVPMILVNGCTGSIGTGWSSTILPHNVKDLVGWITCWLNGQDPPALVPFYKGFKGVLRVNGDNKVITEGIVTLVKDAKYAVSELPIGKKMLSISKYKEKLVALEDAGVIKGIDNQSTENTPYFSFTLVTPLEGTETLLDKLGLTDTNYTSNMVLFDAQGKLKKYATTEEIMQEWCLARFEQYNIRKAALLKSMQQESSVLYNRIRFIEMVLDGKIVMKNKDEETLVKELKGLKFELDRDGYDYLLNTAIKMFTSKHTANLMAKYTDLVAATKALADKPIKDIWLGELKEVLEKCS